MILKKITLNNIRSYKNQEVRFPEGSTLLSGDIGSGKTSVLLGIEFALFGLQPGQRGSSLLKNGENEGGVVLEFEVDGKEIVVERTLKKGKTISQDYCAININGEKKEFSVTELKDRVLEILSYPKEFSKKQNILYKFTVYTPQEEMKQIILEDPDTRVNTLRHVFGIDKYKKILENAAILSSKLREEKRIRESMIENLEQEKASLVSKEDELEAKHYNLVSIEKELFLKTEERKKVLEEKEEISKKIEERKKLQQEIEKTRIMVLNKKENFSNNLKIIMQIEDQIKESSEIGFDEEKFRGLEGQIVSLKKQREELNEENLRITSQINSSVIKNQENEVLKKKITQIEICPTCLQDVDPVYKSNVVNKLESNNSENIKKIEEFTFDKKKILEILAKVEESLSLSEKQLQEMNISKIKLQNIDEKKKRLEEIKKLNESIQKDTEILNQHIESLNVSVFELNKFENIFKEKQEELDAAMKQERITEIKVAELKKEIEVFSRQIEEFKERIKKTEEIKERLGHITKLEAWLSKDFSSLITFIEKNVMIKLKTEFSKLFERWFSMLVSDVFDVSLDDNFTPIIGYQDYETDYSYLSGGERTAVALAYRLSLNQLVNSLLSKIKTHDIVILDEPTDGFSEQQLDKMRDVLRQLDVRQLIIVSHEQKIESFVENIIRFRKEQGISKIISETFI
ncbi:MAG TPA: AAA family ATPase [Bacillota bacterium]|nr:AAA family ATPase [Bacillota bacterium]